MAKVEKFEWGGAVFSNSEELESLVWRGYFREGHAFGSIRAGWEPVVEWQAVAEIFRDCGVALGKAGQGRVPIKGIPAAMFTGVGNEPGNQLWFMSTRTGQSQSAQRLWALCERWMLAKAKPAAKSKSKKNTSSNASGVKRL